MFGPDMFSEKSAWEAYVHCFSSSRIVLVPAAHEMAHSDAAQKPSICDPSRARRCHPQLHLWQLSPSLVWLSPTPVGLEGRELGEAGRIGGWTV